MGGIWNERSNSWIVAAGAVLALALVTSSPPLGLLGLLLLAVVLTCWLWSRAALARVSCNISVSSDRLTTGERLAIGLTVTNSKPLLVPWIAVACTVDSALLPLDEQEVEVQTRAVESGRRLCWLRRTTAGWYERVSWDYRVRCRARGEHRIGPVRLEAGDPLGLYRTTRDLDLDLRVLAYPLPIPLPVSSLRPKSPVEGRRDARALVEDPMNVVGARPYAEGDSIALIHWRATARSGELHSKLRRPTTERCLAIFLDMATSDEPGAGTDVALVERAISAAATLASRAFRERSAMGLYVNGVMRGGRRTIRVGVGRGDRLFAAVMDVLARVPAYFRTVPIEDLLRAATYGLPPGTEVVVVTARGAPALSGRIEAWRGLGMCVDLVDVRALANPRDADEAA